MFIFIIVSSVIAQGLIALFVLLKNSRSLTHILFALLSGSLVAWATVNFIITQNPYSDNQLILYRSLMASVVVQNSFFLLFAYAFPSKKFRINPSKLKAYLFLSLVTILVTLSPFLFTTVEYGISGARPTTGPGMLVFAIHAFVSIFFGLRVLNRKYKKADSAERRQYKYILFGSVILWVIVPLTNFIITLATQTLFFARISPLYVLAFSSIIAYAIVAQKLFDIRSAVARSVAYVLSLGILVVLYAFISSFISNSGIVDQTNGNRKLIVEATILLPAVLLYPRIKRFFDRTTSTLFYRDSYEPQEFLDQLNKSIVSNIEIGILLRHTTAIIEENLKSSFVQIVVPKTESTSERIAGTQDVKYSDHEINYMRGRLVGLGQKIVSVDNLRSYEDELQKIMNKHNISVLVHLSATSYGQDQTIAFMIFGNKKSGNIYSKQDLKIIEIIADELVIAIQNALRFEEIQDFNVTLQSKVNTATNKLRKTNEKLKLLDETKDEFISMASHQLRTPLTSVKGYLSMVLEGDAGEVNDTQRKLLDQAFVSSQRMVYLIADLLNVSRLRTGKFVINSNPSNLADLIEGEVSQLKEQAKSKNLTLTYEKPKDFPVLMLDETKIRQVVMNFVDNALYYTPSGGKIDVGIAVDKRYVYFTVKDNGLGVPKDEQKHLFTKFYRAKNARNMRPDGTGLGLFMAKKVVTGQGGNILFESVENKGSTFGFSLPLKKLSTDKGDGQKS